MAATAGGGHGGKATGQREHRAVACAPDSEPELRKRGFPLQGVKAYLQQIDGSVVDQRGEPRPLVPTCCLTHPASRSLRARRAMSNQLAGKAASELPALKPYRENPPTRNPARTDLCGGRWATGVPTATKPYLPTNDAD
jgi:hypothetical protein